jgi:hypothetical protein
MRIIVAEPQPRYPFLMNLLTFMMFSLATPTVQAADEASQGSKAEVKSAKMSKAQRRKQSKAEARDIELLQRSANLYWEGVRWNDSEKASNFIEDPKKRMTFQAWFDNQSEYRKLLDAKVIGVDIKQVQDHTKMVTRTATIRVATEGYTIPDQILKKGVDTQIWYRSASGWWLEWTEPVANP